MSQPEPELVDMTADELAAAYPLGPATASSDPLANYVRASDVSGKTFARTWIIEDLIESGRIYEIFGRWKDGKTIAVMDMVAHAATGRTWGDRRTIEALAVYVAGEAVEDIQMRLAAWQLHHGVSDPIPFVVRTKPVYLTQSEFADQLLREVRAWQQEFEELPVLLVIDTLNRNFGPANENSVEDMGAFVTNLIDGIVRPSACTCLVVHHSGHGDSERGRGHSSFAGAVDGSIKVSMDKSSGASVITVSTMTSRTTEGSDQLSFRVETQELDGADNFGNPVEAPVLRYLPDHQPPARPDKPRKLGIRQQSVLEALQRVYQRQIGNLVASGLDSDSVRVLVADWRQEAIESEACSRTMFYDVKAQLIDKGLVNCNEIYATPCPRP